MLIDILDVVEAYIVMGFTHVRVSGRQHKFTRGSLGIIHESVRGIGFDVHHLLRDAAVRGISEELLATLRSIDPTFYKLRPPSSVS